MTELPDHLKNLCDRYDWEYSRIPIVDGVPCCCDTCKHARNDGFIQQVCCTLDGLYWYRISSCQDYERKEQN